MREPKIHHGWLVFDSGPVLQNRGQTRGYWATHRWSSCPSPAVRSYYGLNNIVRLITTYRTNEMLIGHPGRWRIDVYQALLPFIVISRMECTEVVIRVHSMAVRWHFIGGP